MLRLTSAARFSRVRKNSALTPLNQTTRHWPPGVGAILVIALGEGRQQQGEYKIRPYGLCSNSLWFALGAPFFGCRLEVNTPGIIARSGKRVLLHFARKIKAALYLRAIAARFCCLSSHPPRAYALSPIGSFFPVDCPFLALALPPGICLASPAQRRGELRGQRATTVAQDC